LFTMTFDPRYQRLVDAHDHPSTRRHRDPDARALRVSTASISFSPSRRAPPSRSRISPMTASTESGRDRAERSLPAPRAKRIAEHRIVATGASASAAEPGGTGERPPRRC
jgi:hypothetical protein